jgi:transposase
VGADAHWVAVPPDRDERPVQCFGAFTADLYALAAWLRQCQIETVVLESTGVYGIALFEVLEERGFDVKLVDAHQARQVPERKTDVTEWSVAARTPHLWLTAWRLSSRGRGLCVAQLPAATEYAGGHGLTHGATHAESPGADES